MESINYNKLLHRKIKNNIYLSDIDIEILNKYNIIYDSCNDIKELICIIEDYLEDSYEELTDLEDLSLRLSEFSYYNFTNK